jgi:hypothetical protein
VKRLLIVSAFLVVLSGCGLGEGRDVRAYNACVARHPQDVVVCEGPRQAYEVDPTIVQAISAGGGPAAGHGYGEGLGSSSPPLAPLPLRPSPIQYPSPPTQTDNRPASQLSLRSVPASSDARRFALAVSGSRP